MVKLLVGESILPRKFLMAAALVLVAGAARAADDPVAAIQAIYGDYVNAEKAGVDAPDDLSESFYSARINALIAEMRKTCVEGEPCGPDYDFLVEGQDFKLRDIKVKLLSREGAKARVEAQFDNLGAKEDKIFSMVQEGGWKIDEIETKGGETSHNLTELLIETTKSQKP